MSKPLPYKRICVIGCCGAGKSTLSKSLAQRLSLPLFHIDQIFWLPNWTARDTQDFQKELQEIVDQDAWVMDGNYKSTLAMRLESSDLVVWLDYSTWRCLLRVLWRIMRCWHKQRDDMAPGCSERFDIPFLIYVARFRKKTRPYVLEILEKAKKTCEIVVLHSPEELEKWTKEFMCEQEL